MKNEISLILIIFVSLLILSLLIKSKTKSINAPDTTKEEIKNTISKMLKILEENYITATMFISIITVSQGIHDRADYEAYDKEKMLFFEKNEENFIKYRNLQSELFAVIDETALNRNEYAKLDDACSAGAFCFDKLRELFVAMDMYFLIKDEEHLKNITDMASEIYAAHEISQYINEFSNKM